MARDYSRVAADLCRAMSAFVLISSGLPSAPDVADTPGQRLSLTHSGHCAQGEERGSLSTLRETLVKIGAKVVRHVGT